MRRRDFIAFGGAAIARPRAAQASEMRRIAVLTTFGDSDVLAQGWDAAFRKGLDESGWHDGRNVKIDYRWPPAMPIDYGHSPRSLSLTSSSQ
jgi:putative ABC transport system substrate-binding protein